MKYILLISACIINFYAIAQFCGNSGPSACTPTAGAVPDGLSPAPQLFAPFNNGQPSSASIQIQIPDTIYGGVNRFAVNSFEIDSIENLPSGLCWSTNRTDNTFLNGEHGCIVLSGTPCAANGQYKLRIYATVNSPSPLGFLLYRIEMDDFGFKYFVRLKNSADGPIAVDTMQTDNNPIIPYNSAPACSGGGYLTPVLLSSDTVCDGSSVDISLLTNLHFSASNYFKLRLACTTTFFCPQHLTSDSIRGRQSGTYTFTLPDSLVYYAFGCTDWYDYDAFLVSTDSAYQVPIGRIHVKPAAKVGNVFTGSICQGGTIDLAGYMCTDQTNSLYEEPSHTFLSASNGYVTVAPQHTTHYSLVAERGTCRADTSFKITVNPNPVIILSDSIVSTCPNDSVRVQVLNAGPSDYCLWYDVNSNFISSQPTLSVLSPNSNTYTVSLYDSNACVSRRSVSVNVKQRLYQDICMVTVDSSSTHNVIVWEKYDKPATDSFYIYREVSTNTYVRIASIHKDSLSEYHDYGANPNSTGYRYRISALDTCGNEGYQSFYHNSIHLQYLGGGNLQWNNYEIEFSSTPVASYDILRDDNGTGVWSQILNVSGTQNTASDAAFASYPNAHYKVVSNWSYNCNPSRAYQASLSNSIMTQPSGIISNNEMSFRISPNPTSGVLHISFPKLVSGNMTIKDITGKEIITADVKVSINETIHIEHLLAGIYIVTFRNEETTYSQKVVKE